MGYFYNNKKKLLNSLIGKDICSMKTSNSLSTEHTAGTEEILARIELG